MRDGHLVTPRKPTCTSSCPFIPTTHLHPPGLSWGHQFRHSCIYVFNGPYASGKRWLLDGLDSSDFISLFIDNRNTWLKTLFALMYLSVWCSHTRMQLGSKGESLLFDGTLRDGNRGLHTVNVNVNVNVFLETLRRAIRSTETRAY